MGLDFADRLFSLIRERRLPYRIKHRLGSLHTLPDFIIIGAQKCGTTTMYDFLTSHSHVHRADYKEVNFFNFHYERGISWYQARFPLALRRSIGEIMSTPWVTGEASPDYLVERRTAHRCYRELPQVRLIVLLRDPVDRAYSQWRMNVRREFESLTFDEAINLDPHERSVPSHSDTGSLYQYGYLYRGEYAERLCPWLDLFSREQFLFVQSEHFKEKPREVMVDVFEFLGLPPTRLDSYKPTYTSPNYGPMSKECRKSLKKYYIKKNKKLFNMIGKEFESWEK